MVESIAMEVNCIIQYDNSATLRRFCNGKNNKYIHGYSRQWMDLFVVVAYTYYCEVVHVVQKPRSGLHTNAQLMKKVQKLRTPWKTDGMGINIHRHHVGTIKMLNMEKYFLSIADFKSSIYLKYIPY
jgi:hypothetical protein